MSQKIDSKQRKTVLVTGANGFIGYQLIQTIMASGRYCVKGTSKNTSSLLPHFAQHYHSMDIVNKDEIEQVIRETRPEYVVHTAAMSHADECEASPELCYQLNTHAVKDLIDICERYGVKHVCFFSTDFVFDGLYGPYTEMAPVNPINVYGKSKCLAEDIVQASVLSTSIIRTVLVYGKPHTLNRSNFVVWAYQQLGKNKTLNITNDQWRTPTYIDDLVAGCVAILDQQAEGIFHLSGSEFLTPFDMAQTIAEYFDFPKALIVPISSDSLKSVAKRPARTGLVCDKARHKLGFNAYTFLDNLQKLDFTREQ